MQVLPFERELLVLYSFDETEKQSWLFGLTVRKYRI